MFKHLLTYAISLLLILFFSAYLISDEIKYGEFESSLALFDKLIEDEFYVAFNYFARAELYRTSEKEKNLDDGYFLIFSKNYQTFDKLPEQFFISLKVLKTFF